jgi:hypothetical protein
MDDSRKKPGVAFWAAVVLSVAGLYIGSSGPVYWWFWNWDVTDSWWNAYWVFYKPLRWVRTCGPSRLDEFLYAFLHCGHRWP